MADTNGYFPSLDKCLAGNDRLIPWKTAYRLLCDPSNSVDNDSLQHFLECEAAVKALTNPLHPWDTPSAESKGRFETRTAPIHVSQSNNGDYNLDELKKDALWLSEALKVEEEAALRVAIVECQSRAADQLVWCARQPQNAQPVEGNGLSASVMGHSMLGSALDAPMAAETLDFGNENMRRTRILQTYIDERQAVMYISTALIGRLATESEVAVDESRTWINKLARQIAKAPLQTNGNAQQKAEHREHLKVTITKCTDSARRHLVALDDTSKQPSVFTSDFQRQDLSNTAILVDLATTLRLMLAVMHMLDWRPSAGHIQKWFDMMAEFRFLLPLEGTAAIPNVVFIQALASLVSLAMLSLHKTRSQITQEIEAQQRGVTYANLHAYIHHDECIKSVNNALLTAAESNNELAAPVLFAWSLIAILVRDGAEEQRLTREAQQQRSLAEATSSDTEGADATARRTSTVEQQETPIEKRWNVFNNDLPMSARNASDIARYCAEVAVDRMEVSNLLSGMSGTVTHAYGGEMVYPTALVAKLRVLELLREGLGLVTYNDEVMAALLTVLTPNISHKEGEHFGILPTLFMADAARLRPMILEEALKRFPYELSPVLRLSTVLASADSERTDVQGGILAVLEHLRLITVEAPNRFRSYQLENEDEGSNRMVLTDHLPLFGPRQHLSFAGERRVIMDRTMSEAGQEGPRTVRFVPAGTAGFVLREDSPMVMGLEHEYSALEYLGLLLSTMVPGGQLVPMGLPNKADLDRGTAAEIVALITALFTASLRENQDADNARYILGRFGNALPQDTDIVSIISELFELELLAHMDQASQPGSLDLCVACAEFFTKLTYVSPERVWSLLARSSLLGANASLATVVSGFEVQLGSFRFLAACAKLYAECAANAVTGLVKRKTRTARSQNRFDSPVSAGPDETPERTISNGLAAYTRVMLDVCLNLSSWHFTSTEEKSGILADVLVTFGHLLKDTYGLEAPPVPPSKDGTTKRRRERISAPLVQAAERIMDTFAPASGASSPLFQQLGVCFDEAVVLGDDLLPFVKREALCDQTLALCEFVGRLLRDARVIEPARAFRAASAVMKSMPALATLFVAAPEMKFRIATLLREVVESLACTDAEPPSLLSGFSTEAAKSFLSVVSHLDEPVTDEDTECVIWQLLTAVLESRQQWFSMYLLTGTLPKDRLRSTATNGAGLRGKTVLDYALDNLGSKIAEMEPARAREMLRFVSAAQSTWIWASLSIRSHPDFLNNMLTWLEGLPEPVKGGPRASSIAQRSELESHSAASLCDILAVCLHASLETGDKTVLEIVAKKLEFLSKHADTVNAYNRSLHRNLADNLKRKFTQVELADFKRSTASALLRDEGRYDTQFADQALGYQQVAWHGNSDLGTEGFAAELERANSNLSLLDAQTSLLRAWKRLATTLSECVMLDGGIQAPLIETAKNCLLRNVEANGDEPGTADAVQIRAEMAFVLMSKLVGTKCEKEGMKALLPAAWESVLRSPVNYDVATDQEDLHYYRTLLQILFLSIKPHVYMALPPVKVGSDLNVEPGKPSLPVEVAGCLADIVGKTIAPAFRALCGNLHADLQLAMPGDFALVTALLQAILSVRGIGMAYSQLADIVANSSLVRGALSLYSWSDQLAEVMGQDPIYGEIAASLLVSLSSVPQIAEQMALQGVLLQLSGANLSNYFRKPGGKGQWDEPGRMFTIWTEGFLPLCLNLLDAVGSPLAAEVTAFLNSFPEQLSRAEAAFKTDGPSQRRNPHSGDVTLGLAREAHSLVLIGLTLQSDLANAAAEGLNGSDLPALNYDLENAKAEVEKLARTQRSLADKVVPANEREAAWANQSTSEAGESVLFQKVLEEIQGVLRCFGGS